jgi:hypothetical protein
LKTAEPMKVSEAFSELVYAAGRNAVDNPKHPCRCFVDWQRDLRDGEPVPFQLPEAFSGRQSTHGILIVGLNPSFDERDEIPVFTKQADFKSYDSFFRGRFDGDEARDSKKRLLTKLNDGTKKRVKFWNMIEKFGSTYLCDVFPDGFRLGEHAILTQAVRFKSTKGWLGNPEHRDGVLAHERDLTLRLLRELKPSVVVAAGMKAYREISSMCGETEHEHKTLTDVLGQVIDLDGGPDGPSIKLVVARHFSRGEHAEEWRAVAQAIRTALQGS